MNRLLDRREVAAWEGLPESEALALVKLLVARMPTCSACVGNEVPRLRWNATLDDPHDLALPESVREPETRQLGLAS